MEQMNFGSVDEVQQLIRRLKEVEENMLTQEPNPNPIPNDGPSVNGSNGTNEHKDDPFRVLEDHELFDYENLCNEPDDIWLIPESLRGQYLPSRTLPLPHEDTSWLDEHLITLRNKYINFWKSITETPRPYSAYYSSPTTKTPVKVKRTSSYIIRSDKPTVYSPISPVSMENSPTQLYYTAHESGIGPDSALYSPNPTSPGFVPETPQYYANTSTPYGLSRKETYFSGATTTRISDGSRLQRGNFMSTKAEPARPHNLNSTFTAAVGSDTSPEVQSNNSGSSASLNNSGAMDIDDIESIAKIQEQSLNMVTSTPITVPLERRNTRVAENRDYGVTNGRRYTRTSSNDTYSVGDSNPTSGTSSVISSPREFQSCEDIQSASEGLRRSMPNLSFMKNNRNQTPNGKSQYLSKNTRYHSSDLKLDQAKNHNSQRITSVEIDSLETGEANTTLKHGSGGQKSKPRLTRGYTFNKPTGAIEGDGLNNTEIYYDGDEDHNKYRYNTIVKQSHPNRGTLPQFNSSESIPKQMTGTFTRRPSANDTYPGPNTTFSKGSSGIRPPQISGTKIPGPGTINSRLRPLHTHDPGSNKREDWRNGEF